MARRRRSRDWQERAFDERENQRRDSTAGVQSDVPDPMRISTDVPRRSSLRWTAAGLGVLVVAVIIRNGVSGSKAPTLTPSCTTPAMALSATSTHQGANVHWSVTGPAGSHLVITIGVGRLVAGAKAGQLHPVPDAGGSAGKTQIAVTPGVLPSSCAAHGEFSVGVPAGHYNVRLFTLTGSGTAGVTGAVAETKPLTVKS
jgi:hypothetical protein